jgi:exonuclease III
MTLATAPNDHTTLETFRNSYTSTGIGLSGTRGVPDSAASQNSDNRPREIGGRPQAARRHTPDRTRGTNTTATLRKGKNTRATLKVASLNMRGRGTEKWNHINQMMRDSRIGILAVQEAHLDDPRVVQLEELFPKRIKIYHTADPTTPNARGVALVLNKELTNISGVTTQEIIPGRAILLQTNWHRESKLTILAIYAPNVAPENQVFWERLQTIWQTRNLPKPDILLGDFNLVEDNVDRLPSHSDSTDATEALDNFKSSLQLLDGWRKTYPTTRMYSYSQKASGSQSRIDRIYVTEQIFKYSYEWSIQTTGISTDHKLVSVLVANPTLPYIGNRWMIPVNLLKNKTLLEEIQQLVCEAQTKIEGYKL